MRNYPPNLYMASDNEGNIYFSLPSGNFYVYDLKGKSPQAMELQSEAGGLER